MAIYEKLFKIQGELSPVKKDKDNPYFKSKYADINQILSMLKPILSEHKILLMQNPVESNDTTIALNTILYDVEDGSSIESVINLPFGTKDPQKAGSSITYARRYALKSIFCMEDVDDDGEGHKVKFIDYKELKELTRLDHGKILSDVCIQKGWGEPVNIPADKFSSIKKYLLERKKDA